VTFPYGEIEVLSAGRLRPATDDPDWTYIIPVGNVTSVSFPFLAKDNYLIGLRAVDTKGHHSAVAFPTLVP
jgi:hypothetical protein